jgi:type I restriction enzyme S subunit
MNETLEAMARALFKSWFVDFDPVRAKAEGRDPGLPQSISELFPGAFEETESGELPKGWKGIPLPEALEVNPARSLRKGDIAPYLDMANMPTRGHSPDGVVARPFGSGMRFMNGDTLVARITPCLENGKTAYVDFLKDGEIGWGSTEYIGLHPKPPLPTEFAYCLARSEGFRDFAIQSMTGTSGRQRVPAESLSHFLIAVPPPSIAESFGLFVSPLLARASAGVRQSRTLAALRDTLLPKLVSGELRVKDAVRAVEAVA